MPSLRPQRRELSRLAWAFGISLVIHLLSYGTYKEVSRHHWLDNLHLPSWLQRLRPPPRTALQDPKLLALLQQQQREPPLMFVEVNPAVATPEPPKEAKFYSDKNSLAANPKADKETGVPRIDGTRTEVPRTETVTRPTAAPLQPALPAQPKPTAERTETQAEELRARPVVPPGDLVMAKPELVAQPDTGQAAQTRPRTVEEAKARLAQAGGLAGEKMKQDGGVKRVRMQAAFDARATPFGAYDAAVIAAVQNRWYYLLDSGNFARERTGKVVLEFKLWHDGRITDMKVQENTVDELLCLLCQKAVLDPAPYEKWPSDMRRLFPKDFREVTFTFYYY
jgi:hypothetical protein